MNENPETKQSNLTSDKISNMAQEAADRVTKISGRVQNKAKRIGKKVQSSVRDMDLDEATIPDAFEKVPKLISPRAHAWLDLAVTTYFLGVGIWCAWRRKPGPATAALINAGMVAGVSLMTDYDGDGDKPINFKLHGTLDAVQAATAALGPVIHGFADEPEAKFFWGQAVNEVLVIGSTDWDAGMPATERERAA